jgi:hypothetical protein
VGIHYQVLSTGKSKRDATTVHTQGAYVIQTANMGGNKLERRLEDVGIKLD